MHGMMRAVGLSLLLGMASAVLAHGPAMAQDGARRQVITTERADYAGYDYSTLRDIALADCEKACTADGKCRAFTYNTAARWCFLKSDFGPLSVAEGAVAGRVVEVPVPTESLQQTRLGEITFLSGPYVDEARSLAGRLGDVFAPVNKSYSELRAAGLAAREAGEQGLAAIQLGRALSLAPEDPRAWIEFGMASLARPTVNDQQARDVLVHATAAGINGYLRSQSVDDRAAALVLIGAALERRQVWRPAIKAYRAALALKDNPVVADTLERVVAQHGFRVVGNSVDADSATPRICVALSDPPEAGIRIGDFVSVSGGDGLSIEVQESQVCVEGVRHGGRYEIRLRAGLPSADGETLLKTVDLALFVRDRAPWVGFAGQAYVLPAGRGATIPIQSVNTEKAEAAIYRIGDRGLAQALRNGSFLSQLENYRVSDIADSTGARIWEGQIEITSTLNEMVTTAVPVEEALPQLEPGVYIITARAPGSEQEYWEEGATQWFIVSDLGLTALTGHDGIHALVRSLATAEPVAGAKLRLVAVNNEVLGEAVTDADGHARFEPGLARGTGGMAPQLVTAETGADYAFLDVTKTAFDLTDRGVDGRPAPNALDVYMTTERGIYRPGETVYATALVRDSQAKAVGDLPLTIVAQRPDGAEAARAVLSDRGKGGYLYSMILDGDAMRGSWTLELYSDPKGAPVAAQSFLVEDFEPERLAFEAKTAATVFTAEAPITVDIEARYLYGATAPDLTVEGDIAIRPTNALAAFPGYRFGRDDESIETLREPIDAAATTDAEGKASLDISLPGLAGTTRLYNAQLVLRLTDTNGRAVERSLSLPVEPDGPRLGLKPARAEGTPEGGPAAFDAIAVAPDGTQIDMPGVTWTLYKVDTRYQWYAANGQWRWEPFTTTARVDDGTVDLAAGKPVRVSSGAVSWGRYRLELTSADGTVSASSDFSAGWYVSDAGTDTPDVLQVALDKPGYAVGDTAKLRLEPRFAGIALITVMDDRVIAMKSVAVPAEGTSVDLPVTADWGPGAYVTATLYRPMDLEAKRMPARALGLAWAKVEPGDRQLAVSLAPAEESRPRGPLTIPVSIDNLKPGEEAYIAVAAVDLGILNLTNYQAPDPDGWYFGQRRLGMEIRDLYGQLIDRTQGIPGRLRSGGDGGPVRLGAPPPTQKLVAYHSGIVRVGADGKATVSFDVPDFNGTVRIMAQAWSAEGVGHAVKDVFVRDPVVMALSSPRFLHTGDTSRLLIELNNVSGPAGDYRLEIGTGEGIGIRDADANKTVTLAAQQRATLAVPLSGDAIGDHDVVVTLVTPDGQRLPKDFALGVRPPGEPVARQSLVALAGGRSLTLGSDMFSEFVPGTASLTVSAGAASRLDVPAVLQALDRYPYGCAEQITSRALPLLYLDEVAATIGIGADSAVHERIQAAITSVLAKQGANGAFGLWSPFDDQDLWLNAYVTDFLLRAAAKGYEVPDVARTIALDNLANNLAYVPDFDSGGEAVAYALYVLAKAGRAVIGDLRYYGETKLGAFSTPLAKAQIGAALALYGDKPRAARVFEAALADMRVAVDPRNGWRRDYGSVLRDSAAVLTLASESGQGVADVAGLADRVAELRQQRRYVSTQENAWTLMAAASLIRDLDRGTFTIGGETVTGSLFRKYVPEQVTATPVALANAGTDPVEVAITATGIPTVPEPATSDGFTIERTYYKPDGTLADIATVAQNDRFVVTLTVTADRARAGRIMVVDPLPAGFEIENPNISASGNTSLYPWLTAESYVAHSEARTDRYMAALNRNEGDALSFTVAYTVRAVSPGKFVHPGATVEDMYRPELRANTATDNVEVVGPTQ